MRDPLARPEDLDPDVLDRAARAAYDASCSIHDQTPVDRDFKVQIAGWRAIAQAVASSTQTLLPSTTSAIDRSLGIPEGSNARLRSNAVIDLRVESIMVMDTMLDVARSAGSGGPSADGHRTVIDKCRAHLMRLSGTPMGRVVDLRTRLDR